MTEERTILETTPTSSATEHDSSLWIFKGGQIFILLGGMFCSFIVLLVTTAVGISGFVSLCVSVIPAGSSIVYVILFFLGKPPHYQRDFSERIFGGIELDYSSGRMRKNPLFIEEGEEL